MKYLFPNSTEQKPRISALWKDSHSLLLHRVADNSLPWKEIMCGAINSNHLKNYIPWRLISTLTWACVYTAFTPTSSLPFAPQFVSIQCVSTRGCMEVKMWDLNPLSLVHCSWLQDQQNHNINIWEIELTALE